MSKPYRKAITHSPWFYDKWLLITTLSLIAFGLLMVASASMVISDRQFDYPFHYFMRQAIYISFALLLGWVATRVPVETWQKYSVPILLAALFLLLIVLIPGIGRVVNGSRRWIYLGFITLQVSEVAKLAMVLYMASYLQRYQREVVTELKGFVKPMLLLGLMAVLLLAEPDFGALVVISATVLMLLFIAGVRLWIFSLISILVVGAFAVLAVISPYRMARLTSFLNPWSHQFDSGYQLTQSLIAFGRGGFFGVGLGNSVQKLFYLPEAHTDFLFAVVAEELGLVGEILFLAIFVTLIARIFFIAHKAFKQNQLFSAYVSYGCGAWFGMQALINVGVNAGLLPTKGLTLPFISYGGSSMLINCIVIGILLRISYELQISDGVIRRFMTKLRA
ncbi:MAG TPA: putative lipid II flippase FtsW [Coxiellaceae bacterium]|nr:putative lipid II flippase FtsW [Coxiellaceae bacterium]